MQRLVQLVARISFKLRKTPEIPVVSGKNTIEGLCGDIVQKKIKSVFIASGKTIRKRGMLDKLIEKMESENINVVVFSDIVSDPTSENVENGVKLFNENKCECVIAAGGGSVLDCAKVIALRAANPHISLNLMYMHVIPCRKAVPLYAVPTTSGTGSEVTYFSVVTNTEKNKKKIVISDKFLPEKIIFDYELLRQVPEKPTIYSGLDALTHSIESFISTNSRFFADDITSAPEVCRDIFRYLPLAARDPDNEEARLKMSYAAYLAGLNFRKVCVGYVHALAHRLGEMYGIPHGLACAVTLPVVLKEYLPKVSERLCDLAVKSGIARSSEEFIDKIIELDLNLGITAGFRGIDKKDYPVMVKRVQFEVMTQGCPVRFDSKKIENIFDEITISD